MASDSSPNQNIAKHPSQLGCGGAVFEHEQRLALPVLWAGFLALAASTTPVLQWVTMCGYLDIFKLCSKLYVDTSLSRIAQTCYTMLSTILKCQ